MANVKDVSEVLNLIIGFCKKEGLVLFPNIPSGNLVNVDAPDTMTINSFLNLVKALECKILYYEVILFEVDSDYDDQEDMEYENKIIIENELKAFNEKWEKMINKPISIEIVFCHNCVSHTFEVREAWLSDYENDLNMLEERVRSLQESENLKRFEESERSSEKKREYIENNKANWCNVVAKNPKFQRARSFATKATIVLEIFPELEEYTYGSDRYLVGQGCNSVIDMIIQNATEIAEGILIEQIFNLHKQGKSGRSIAGILDVSEHKVSKVLAKKIQHLE